MRCGVLRQPGVKDAVLSFFQRVDAEPHSARHLLKAVDSDQRCKGAHALCTCNRRCSNGCPRPR